MPTHNKRLLNMVAVMVVVVVVAETMIIGANASDNNDVWSPCLDAKVQKLDGFTFGVAFSSRESFFLDQVQLSPCDSRLALSTKMAQLAMFRPKVDEISLLTINSTSFNPATSGYMVAFAGRKYAARSPPIMVVDNSIMTTSFTLVLEFQKGTLQNLYWKNFGCEACPKSFVCNNGKDCAIQTSRCKSFGGSVDCNLGIQLAFSGTDKNLESLNSWYEVSNLRQYSLYGLYKDLHDSIDQFAGQF